MPFVPTGAAEHARAVGSHILHVRADAGLDARRGAMRVDIRPRDVARQKIANRLIVAAHARVVCVAEHPQHERRSRTDLHLEVLGARARDVPVERDAVGHLRHQRFAEPKRPRRRGVFGNGRVSVAARVGRVVVRPIVVDGPVGELQVAVAAGSVDVEEVGETKLAGADLETPRRHARRESERTRRGFDRVRPERDRRVHHHARDVRRNAERRVAHDVEVREAREAERVAQPPPSGALHVDEQLRVPRKRDAGIDRPHARERLLRRRSQAVVAFVRRGESPVPLRDQVHLPGQPPEAVRVVRKHRGRRFLWTVARGLREGDGACADHDRCEQSDREIGTDGRSR